MREIAGWWEHDGILFRHPLGDRHQGRMRFSDPLRAILLATAVSLASGCASLPSPVSVDRPLKSQLSPREVRQIATARAARNGFVVDKPDDWQVTLFFGEQGLKWTALVYPTPGRRSAWVEINDATRQAEFVAPEIHFEQKFAEGSDWLIKIDDALRQTTFPIELETLMKTAHFAGAECNGGGSTTDGRAFLEYRLRTDVAAPARFELRCYYREAPGVGPNPKMVTAAELAYIDARTFRYLLVRATGP